MKRLLRPASVYVGLGQRLVEHSQHVLLEVRQLFGASYLVQLRRDVLTPPQRLTLPGQYTQTEISHGGISCALQIENVDSDGRDISRKLRVFKGTLETKIYVLYIADRKRKVSRI